MVYVLFHNHNRNGIKYIYALRINYYFVTYIDLIKRLCVLGLYVNYIFFSFLLLEIIDRSAVLQNIITAIKSNAKTLSLTMTLGTIIMFNYGTIGYYTDVIRTNMVYS